MDNHAQLGDLYNFTCLFQDITYELLLILDNGWQDRANEIYKKVEDLKSVKGRNQDAIFAACIYIACRQEDKPRTVKGIFAFGHV